MWIGPAPLCDRLLQVGGVAYFDTGRGEERLTGSANTSRVEFGSSGALFRGAYAAEFPIAGSDGGVETMQRARDAGVPRARC